MKGTKSMFAFINSLNYYAFLALCLTIIVVCIICLIIRKGKSEPANRALLISGIITISLIIIYRSVFTFSNNETIVKYTRDLYEIAIALFLFFNIPITFMITSKDERVEPERRKKLKQCAIGVWIFAAGLALLFIEKLVLNP